MVSRDTWRQLFWERVNGVKVTVGELVDKGTIRDALRQTVDRCFASFIFDTGFRTPHKLHCFFAVRDEPLSQSWMSVIHGDHDVKARRELQSVQLPMLFFHVVMESVQLDVVFRCPTDNAHVTWSLQLDSGDSRQSGNFRWSKIMHVSLLTRHESFW